MMAQARACHLSMKTLLLVFLIFYKKPWGQRDWRDGSAVKGIAYCSPRGPSFNSQHPCGNKHPPIAPVPRDPTHSSGLYGQRTATHTGKTTIHIAKTIKI